MLLLTAQIHIGALFNKSRAVVLIFRMAQPMYSHERNTVRPSEVSGLLVDPKSLTVSPVHNRKDFSRGLKRTNYSTNHPELLQNRKSLDFQS